MGVIKKIFFLVRFLNFRIMGNHHAKRYFYNEKPHFLHTYASDHFFLFFIFFIQTVLFTISKSEPPDFGKIFQEKNFEIFS